MLEWFRPGEHERVERVLTQLAALGIRRLRTGVSWAEWECVPGGRAWISWLVPRLAAHVHVLPCFVYTPPSLGVRQATNAPPRDPGAYAAFIDEMLRLFGEHFEYIEL